jgi:hypothetical protein
MPTLLSIEECKILRNHLSKELAYRRFEKEKLDEIAPEVERWIALRESRVGRPPSAGGMVTIIARDTPRGLTDAEEAKLRKLNESVATALSHWKSANWPEFRTFVTPHKLLDFIFCAQVPPHSHYTNPAKSFDAARSLLLELARLGLPSARDQVRTSVGPSMDLFKDWCIQAMLDVSSYANAVPTDVSAFQEWLREQISWLQRKIELYQDSPTGREVIAGKDPFRETAKILRQALDFSTRLKIGLSSEILQRIGCADLPGDEASLLLEKILHLSVAAQAATTIGGPAEPRSREELLTQKAAASRAKCDKSTMTKYIDKGIVESREITSPSGKIKRMVVQASLDRAIADRTVRSSQAAGGRNANTVSRPRASADHRTFPSERARKVAKKYDL